MINDIRFLDHETKSLDQWVADTIGQIAEVVYEVMLEINQAFDEVSRYVR